MSTERGDASSPMDEDAEIIAADNQSEGDSDLFDEEIISREAKMMIERLPEASRTTEVITSVVIEVVKSHSRYNGPTPSPKMLAELKEVDETLPNRAMVYAEKEQSHRHNINQQHASAFSREQWLAFSTRTVGQSLAFVAILAVIISVAVLLYGDKKVDAFAPIIYSLAALAGVLIAAKTVGDVIDKSRGGTKDDD